MFSRQKPDPIVIFLVLVVDESLNKTHAYIALNISSAQTFEFVFFSNTFLRSSSSPSPSIKHIFFLVCVAFAYMIDHLKKKTLREIRFR